MQKVQIDARKGSEDPDQMKSLPLVLALLTSSGVALTSTTVTGVIRDSSHNPAASGQVTFTLRQSNDGTVSGSVPSTPEIVVCPIATTGNVVGAANSNVTTTSGTTSPATALTVASASGFAINQPILIAGAGVSGIDYVGTISNIVGTTFTVSPATFDSVSPGAAVYTPCQIPMNTALQPPGAGYLVKLSPGFVDTATTFMRALNPLVDITSVVAGDPQSPKQGGVVDTFSDQTVAGNKTFSGSNAFTGSASLIHRGNFAPAAGSYPTYLSANIGGFVPGDFNTIRMPLQKFDAFTSEILIPRSNANLVYGTSNYGAYCATQADSRLGTGSSGNHNYCNTFFGISQALVSHSAAGGMNNTIADAPGTTDTWLGGTETDFWISGHPAKITGFQLTLNGTGTPPYPNSPALEISQSAITGAGTNNALRWSQGLVVGDYATAGEAVAVGTFLEAPNPSPSQVISFNFVDARGKEHFGIVHEEADQSGDFVLTPAGAKSGAIQGAVKLAGPLLAAGIQTVSGCRLTGAVGGASAGSFKSGTTGTCSVTVTPGIRAPNGFHCTTANHTHPADVLAQTDDPLSATAPTISGTTSSGDLITWSCTAF
jgi:hypothetical protein